MIRALRQCFYAALPPSLPRKPALRRALPDTAWLATDLPLFAPEAVPVLMSALPDWHFETASNGWLLMDAPLPCPLPQTTHLPEIDCLISLLKRHPSQECDSIALHRLVKAAETSAATLSKEAQLQHQQWAVRLREHKPLPSGLLPWLEAL